MATWDKHRAQRARSIRPEVLRLERLVADVTMANHRLDAGIRQARDLGLSWSEISRATGLAVATLQGRAARLDEDEGR